MGVTKITRDKKAMKVLFIRSSVGFGGAEVYNLNLFKGVKELGLDWQTSFITNHEFFAERLRKLGVETKLISVSGEEPGTKKSLLRFLFAFPLFLFKYLEVFRSLSEDFDIICLQSGTEKIVLTPFLRLWGKKGVWLEHGPVFAFKKFWLINFLYLQVSCLTNLILTVSGQARKDLINGGVGKEKVVSVQTGIDANFFSPLSQRENFVIREELGFKEDDFVIGFVGAICFEKGIKEFLRVASVLVKKDSSFKFLVVGEGPELSWAKKQADKDCFVFTGFKEEIKPFLGAMNLFFFPTNHLEGLSLTLMEAMALEKLVLIKDIGGNRELVTNKGTGYLYSNRDNSYLVDLITKIKREKTLSKEMGKSAREKIVKDFNLDDWVKKLDGCFKEVING